MQVIICFSYKKLQVICAPLYSKFIHQGLAFVRRCIALKDCPAMPGKSLILAFTAPAPTVTVRLKQMSSLQGGTSSAAFHCCGLIYWFRCGQYGPQEKHPGRVLHCLDHKVHRVATAAFWRTFSSVMRVKLAWLVWGGVHAHPLLLHLPSPVKLQCTLQLSGQTH